MRIPAGRSGHPTVSATQLRAYGAGGFLLDGQEEPRGCPRKYKARYVDGIPDERTDRMDYGVMFHRLLEEAENEGTDPYQVLARVFPASMDPALLTEARRDLDTYLGRESTQLDDMHTVATEMDIEAELYVDDVHGPVWYRAILDKVSVVPEQPSILHVTDYKLYARPPSKAQLRGDMQLRGQAWLAGEHWRRSFPALEPVQVWTHLDPVKWQRPLSHQYSGAELDDWRTWAVAVCRTILRDESAEPEVNTGCTSCMVRHDCPAYGSLPTYGAALVRALGTGTLEQRVAWRDTANEARLLLEKAVKQVDSEIAQLVYDAGPLIVGGHQWAEEAKTADFCDLRRLQELLGDQFWYVISAAKTRVGEVIEEWPASQQEQVLSCWETRVVGSQVKRSKHKPR